MCSLEQLLFVLSFSYLASAQSRVCGSVEYDITPLLKEEYWEIVLEEKDCSFFSSKCTVYVGFCNEVPLEVCGNPGSSGDSSVCVTNETGKGYSLGQYTDDPFLQIPKKLIASFEEGSDAQCQNKKIKTNITFDCYPTANWEYAWNNDASGFFGSIIVDFEDLCSVNFNVHYDRVCPEALCNAGEYDISPLIGPDHWEADVKPQHCKEFFGNAEKCTLYVSFCDDMLNVPGCHNSSVCLSNGTNHLILGRYSKYDNPFTYEGTDGLLVVFENGANYSKCPNKLTRTILTLKCASDQDWEYSGDKGNATSHLIGVNPSAIGGCEVVIDMQYSGACAGKSPASSSGGGGTSVGWVGLGLLLGVYVLRFIVIVTLYLTVGSAINMAQGKTNCPEMIPQFAFWRAFFIYFLEGVYFTADLVTCGYCTKLTAPARFTSYETL